MLAGKVNVPLGKVHSFMSFTFRGKGAKLAPAPVGAISAVARHYDNDEEHHDWKFFIIDDNIYLIQIFYPKESEGSKLHTGKYYLSTIKSYDRNTLKANSTYALLLQDLNSLPNIIHSKLEKKSLRKDGNGPIKLEIRVFLERNS